MIIQLPFRGFYESWYSDELNQHEERDMEYRAEEEGWSDELKDKIVNQMYMYQDYKTAELYIAEQYVGEFNDQFFQFFDLDLSLTFSDMSSPREYNFSTDRIFAHISEEKAQALFDLVQAQDGLLEKTIVERCTSYDGFISWYSNRLSEWTDKPLVEWDHNELGMLLYALLPLCEDFEFTVFISMCEGNTFDEAYNESIDWLKFEQALKEMKLEEAGECEEDSRVFPLGVTDPVKYVETYHTMNHLKE